MMKKNTQSGFSLTEMMVTIGIISVVGFWGIPSLAELKASLERSSAKQLVRGDIKLAKTKALEEGVRTVLVVAPGYSEYQIGYDYVPYSNPPVIDESILLRKLPSNISVSTDRDLIFNSRGFLTDVNGSPQNVTVSVAYNGDLVTKMVVYASGMVKE